MTSFFLPGAFAVFVPFPEGPEPAVDVTCLEENRPRASHQVPLAQAAAIMRDHLPVAATPAAEQWWRRTMPGAGVASLAELAGVGVPGVPFRPADLARALALAGEGTGSLFHAEVLAALSRRLAELPAGHLQQLARLLAAYDSPWADSVAGLAALAARVFPDRPLAGKPAAGRRERRPNHTSPGGDPQAALDFLAGPVGARLPGFRRRPQQEEMVRAVAAALSDDRCLLMEGATGTGKSLSYLVPALLWALAGGGRVLVATHTINLQEQLVTKDLPLLREAGLNFTAALVKGRGNYLCLLRWAGVLREEVTAAEAALFARVLVWSASTVSGDRAELGLEGEGAQTWARVQADSDGCPGAACPHWNTDCFVTLARQAAEEADVLVANHSLLFSDILAEGRVLPEYGALIIDEAHHLEDGAGRFLGRRLSLRALTVLSGSSERVLARLAALPALSSAVWRPAVQRCQNNVGTARRLTMAFFERLEKSVWPQEEGERAPWRLQPGALGGLDEDARGLGRAWQDVAAGLDALTGGLAEAGEAWAVTAADLGRLTAQWRQGTADLAAVWGAEDDNQVYWVERERSGCVLCAAPVEVAGVLREKLLGTVRPVVLTSATLTESGSFEHFAGRTGVSLLEPGRVSLCRVESPFDYPKQVLFAVTTGLPGPEGYDYEDALARAIQALVRAAGGRTMVLFTSHQTLRSVYRRLKGPLGADGICLLGHGIDNSRSRLLEEFRCTDRSVLFGAASFWEGVDIPGESLSLLVIVKLPFVPPGDPVQEARLEALARRHENGFARLAVPQAVIRFKQGFGRLIRSTSDRGAVVVLDSRLVTRGYGARFLASLSGTPAPNVADLPGCARRVAAWLQASAGIALR